MTAAALPFAAFPLAFGGSIAAAAQIVPDGPATVLHHGPTPWAMDDNLGGVLCEEPKVCTAVNYQWILPLGTIELGVTENVRALDFAIKNLPSDPGAPEDKIVYAFSGGARVASVWLKNHGRDHEGSTATPAPDDLSFVLIGNGGRKYGGLNGWWYGDALLTPTDTDYAVVDIAREYDPIADFPANPFNLLALANAIAAFDYVHMAYDEVDLDDPDNIVWTEGNTTYVHVPTKNLPLLQGFRDFGLGWLVESWEEPLRAIIDQAYDRTWLEGRESQGGQQAARAAVDAAATGDRTADDAADEVTDTAAEVTAVGHVNGAGDTTEDDTAERDSGDRDEDAGVDETVVDETGVDETGVDDADPSVSVDEDTAADTEADSGTGESDDAATARDAADDSDSGPKGSDSGHGSGGEA
ncbi:PE-PPE domain-containing protein [Mycobacterium sp. 4D054]|uniref:PE-PPE domain-containing protein n=1 Tax=Mycobacterium sp. 4D054 TaxID=3457440 RepID=UPI003FD0BDB6